MNKKVYISSLFLGFALVMSSCPLFAMKGKLANIFSKSRRQVSHKKDSSKIQPICTDFQAKNIEAQTAGFKVFVEEITDTLSAITNVENKKNEAEIALKVIEEYFTDTSQGIEKDFEKFVVFKDAIFMVSESFEKIGFDELVGEILEIHVTMLELVYVIHEELSDAQKNITENNKLEKQLKRNNKKLKIEQKKAEKLIEAAADVCSSVATVQQQVQLALETVGKKRQALKRISDSLGANTKKIEDAAKSEDALI